jgi:hypothetical protein
MTTFQVRPATPVLPPVVLPPADARVRQPVRLGLQTAAALLALAALCVGAILGSLSVRSDAAALRVSVAERAAVAADLRFALADLDAQRADQLVPGHAAADPHISVGNRLLALITAQQRRREISAALRQLGSDTTQADRVRSLLDALGRYDDAGGRTAYVDEQQPDRAAGHPPAIAVAFSAEAGDIMHNDLLPQATALSRGYDAQATAAARTAHTAAVRSLWTVVLLGALALAVLLWWQAELARRYRRLLNPALVLATTAVLAVTLAGAVSFNSAATDLDTSVREGLRPWSRLAEARAVAADAAAAQSRWLVTDPGAAAQQRTRFTTLTRRLDTLLAPSGYATSAELPAYDDVRTRYGHFLADDRHLRRLIAAGRLDEAAAVLTNVARDNVAFDFWDFATTLTQLAAQQRSDATDAASIARSALDGWPAIPAGVLGAASLLVLAGVRPRFAEYR